MERPNLGDRAGPGNPGGDDISDDLDRVGCAARRRQVLADGAERREPRARSQ